MSESDLEQIATLMGHTVGTHRNSYLLSDDIYQTAKISELLLLMEKGNKGKFLNEIEIDLNEDLMYTAIKENDREELNYDTLDESECEKYKRIEEKMIIA